MLYEFGSVAHRWYHHKFRGQHRLPGKTLSVGNLTWGGTGKTQFVTWLLNRQKEHNVAVLTRGYKGGDEAKFYKNRGFLCGVGSDRVVAAIELQHNNREIYRWVLDDGLQHWRIHRDVDIVMVDCLNRFGRTGLVIPFGTLRERPKVGLQRANGVILHNANLAPLEQVEALREKVQQWTNAPIILSKSILQVPPIQENALVVAFAGIGNNDAFFQSLTRRGIRPAKCVSFQDHHSFTLRDIRNLQALPLSNAIYLTTEKDLARNPSLAGPPLFAKAVCVEWSPIDDNNNASFNKLIDNFLT